MSQSEKRKSPVPVKVEELELALLALTSVMDAEGMSPSARVPGRKLSANANIEQELGVTNSRAAYLLNQLIQLGVVERIEHSRKVKVLRETLTSERSVNKPGITGATYEQLKEAILRLNAANKQHKLKIEALEKEVAELRERVGQLESVDIDPELKAVLRDLGIEQAA